MGMYNGFGVSVVGIVAYRGPYCGLLACSRLVSCPPMEPHLRRQRRAGSAAPCLGGRTIVTGRESRTMMSRARCSLGAGGGGTTVRVYVCVSVRLLERRNAVASSECVGPTASLREISSAK